MARYATEMCSVDGCARPYSARGYCNAHYQQMLHGRPLRPLPAEGRDSKHRGLRCIVVGCERARKSSNWCRQHYHYWAELHIDPQTYEDALRLQGGVCAVCGGTNANGRRLSADHDHVTRRMRGVLCANCNRAIGLLRDDVAIVARALAYIAGTDRAFDASIRKVA